MNSTEERDSEAIFGQVWRDYAAATPRFLPRWRYAKDARGAHTH